ncbi:A/G-specific adenine glycosylase [Candidatus Photodesmus katoptron]|uniref:A/G-specific adenine glycosylase n=1 Tax=Candidatus Photodesmus anomalopis TaxID=28176 RepID=UPI0004D5B690|nr:A/G-specific adenine glycosylase [Candidatus Photodesmus katoptron]KEY90088.1 A/G-specific adenine glycosylase [Candidatus Photodesmus katoptron]
MTHFSQSILEWYCKFGRKNLPWQKNKTDYTVWLSEIMLQQTQVSTVIPYYIRFIKTFPNLIKLANAEQDIVLHLWSGLGYYSRAINLHKTAKIIQKEYNGQFPKNIKAINALPGIGRSTAGAIISSVYNKTYPILDGNIKRILTRCFAIKGWPGEKKIENTLWKYAEKYTPQKNTDKYNQAMMDIGAMICTRAKPKCLLCPINQYCISYKKGNPLNYPSKKIKREKSVKKVYFTILQYKNLVWLEQRPTSGVWAGLFSFPEANNPKIESQLDSYKISYKDILQLTKLISFKHTFSHYQLYITPSLVKLSTLPIWKIEVHKGIWYDLLKPKKIGLATPIKYLLERLPCE